MSTNQTRAIWSAQQVYRVVKPFSLTVEQSAAVEQASIAKPSLVVAGAGSGKTELMSVRVLWLVANGFARPEQILGLTFTRKAASELSKRIFESLLKLRDSELWPVDLEYDFVSPTISTYNAYANGLFRDFALAIGHEPDAALLTEGAAFALAREVLLNHGGQIDERLGELDKTPDAMVELILNLAQEMSDNLATSAQVDLELRQVLEKMADLPKKAGSNDTSRFAYIDEIAARLGVNQTLAKLAEVFNSEKRRLGFVDYADQVALAELAVRQVPLVRERERANFTHVLLDEYQDTSFLQARLLRGLFSDSAVYAVGDPNQSIYGWRGASSSNLEDFAKDFCTQPELVGQFSLSTSWRNPSAVLELANHLAAPLANPASFSKSASELKVITLVPRSGAPAGRIEISFHDDTQAEAAALAEWFKSKLTADSTSALLLRSRSNMALFAQVFQDAGLEVEVVGLGGLLEMPEIVDLVCALKVINSPQSGSALIRLLAGPRWRIGTKDLAQLSDFARYRARSFDAELEGKIRASLAVEDSSSIVDALDYLVDEPKLDRFEFSQIGLERLKNAGALFRQMRRQVGLGLVEFVRSVEQELWLDIEVMANPKLKHPMANLNAFANIVANYAASNHRPTLSSFLAWLEFADQRERFEIPAIAPEKGVVQILTIHAAKGLEWHNVAIANLNEGDFPSDRGATTGWANAGVLPYPLRGDRASLPEWNYQSAQTQPELRDSLEAFKTLAREHKLREELRLMYVAVTRPQQNLKLSGSFWKPGIKKPKQISRFLQTTLDFLGQKIELEPGEVNPLELHNETVLWPLEPLGPKYRALLQTSRQLFESLETKVADSGQPRLALPDLISEQIDLLLKEQIDRIERLNEVELPVRIAASRFKDFISDLDQLADRLLRPMPLQPFSQTRTGTLFHSWLEQNYALDVEPAEGSQSDQPTESSIDDLMQNFKKSRWSGLRPIAVEQEIQLTHGAHTFICKLDAVFETQNGIEIVDWKTGKPPVDQHDEDLKALQLALYRAAYAAYSGRALEEISASFYFVAQNQELKPTKLLAPNELFELWQKTVDSFAEKN
jgi:DNA helicase-2/ATP-dependent DNA helicase PcrA